MLVEDSAVEHNSVSPYSAVGHLRPNKYPYHRTHCGWTQTGGPLNLGLPQGQAPAFCHSS